MKTEFLIVRRLLLLGALSLGMAPAVSADSATQEMVLSITPIANVSLELDTTSYAFGAVDVNTSTSSLTSLQLRNTGQVNITVNKHIADESNPVGWTAGIAAGRDTYVLYCATSTIQPALSSFGVATRFGALNNITSLTGTGGSSFVLLPHGPLDTTDLWFRLDMPTTVSSLTARTITIRFTGTAQ